MAGQGELSSRMEWISSNLWEPSLGLRGLSAKGKRGGEMVGDPGNTERRRCDSVEGRD